MAVMFTAMKKKGIWQRTENCRWIYPVISLSSAVILWELTVRLGLLDQRFFPSPTMIVGTLVSYAATGKLWADIEISLVRVVLGFMLGSIPGVLLGLIMGLSPMTRALLNPIVSAIYPLPKSAILPLIILLLGIGEVSKIVFIAISGFFLVLLNTIAGVTHISQIHLDVAKNFGASRKDFYLRVALPGALPMIFTGLKLSLGMCLVLIVLAEFVGAKEGIGYLIWDSWQIFDVSKMYVGLVVIGIMGFILSTLTDWVERVLIPWRPKGK